MRRFFENFGRNGYPSLTWLSFVLVLAAIAVGLWLRSHFAHERLVWHVGSGSMGIVNCNGLLQLKDLETVDVRTGYQRLRGFWNGDERGNWEDDGEVTTNARVFGLGWQSGGVPFQGSCEPPPPPRFLFEYWSITLPHWAIVVLLLLFAFGVRCLNYWCWRDRSDKTPGRP